MGNLLESISLLLQILASVVTIVTAFIAFLQEGKDKEEAIQEESKYPLGHKEIYPAFKWVLIVAFILYYVATISFIWLANVPTVALYSTVLTFVIMLLSFLLLFFRGKKSLETRNVLAPKKLWQLLSKKIPDYLEESDGPFRIKIVKIGMYDPAKGMDNEYGSGKSINDRVEKLVSTIKSDKGRQKFMGKRGLYDISVDDSPFYHRSDAEVIHGIIVIIGDRMSESQVSAKIKQLASKFPDTPIGFLSYGTYPSGGEQPPYINLKYLCETDYIDHLIFRYYARSRAWRRLVDTYHTALLSVSVVLALVMLLIPSAMLFRSISAERTKIVMQAPSSKNKSNFTKLVNYLLLDPAARDVKLWKRVNDSLYVNVLRYAEQGDTSSRKDRASLISQVMEAKVFLMYDPSQSTPYTVWDQGGVKLEGRFDKDRWSYDVYYNSCLRSFKWEYGRSGRSTYDDDMIRVMYAYIDSPFAIEVVYDRTNGRKIRYAARYTPTFLLDIQRLLVFSQMEGLQLRKENFGGQ